MDISDTLTRLRTEKGVYQKELAAYLNVSVGTVSNYEKGIHSPDLDTLCRLADYFSVTTDYLLGRTNFRCDPSLLNRRLTREYTISDIVNTTLELSPRDACLMIDYLNLLKLRSNAGSQPSGQGRK